MRRFLLTVAAAATTLAGSACSDITGIDGGIAGIYELRTINGQSLPVSSGTVTYIAGEIEIDNDGTFIDTYQYRFSGRTFVETEQIFGRWFREGSRIRFEGDDGRAYYMSRTSSNRLVYEEESDGSRWVYQRF
jgi:hypothetical protein